MCTLYFVDILKIIHLLSTILVPLYERKKANPIYHIWISLEHMNFRKFFSGNEILKLLLTVINDTCKMVLEPWLVWHLQAQTPDLTSLFQIKDTWGHDINILCFSLLLYRKGITFCSKNLRIDNHVLNTMLNRKY